MKQTLILILSIISLVCIFRCTKNSSNPIKNIATCTTSTTKPIVHTPDTLTGLWYYLASAFTPNGDGINDELRLYYNNRLNVDSSTITIWDMNGNGVFEGTINEKWNGKDLKGVLCPAGHYPLYLKLRTTAGQQINTCGCVTILNYKGNCIYTGGYAYAVPDELDTATGYTLATLDHLCP